MSSKFAGVTFDEQAATPSDDAIIRRAVLDDGVLTGCEFSYTGSTLTMTAGQLMICGRQIKHPSTQNWAVADATTGFARLLLTIDLTRTASKDTFEQVVDTVEYASALDGFADLVQDDINVSGTRYQLAACVVALAPGGISGIVSQLGQTGGGTGGTLTVTTPGAGITVTASKDGKTKTKVSGADGTAVFKGLEGGTWTITATDGTNTSTDTVNLVTDYTTEMSFVKIYGISRDITASSPAWAREDDAVGKTATASIGTVAGYSDFDSCYPWSEIQRETLSTGDVMVRIPKFWFRRYRSGNIERIKIADKAASGFTLHPAFQHGGVECDHIYVGAYKTSSNNKSVSGASPQVNQTRATMRSNAKAKGAGWSLWDVAVLSAMQMLMLIEFATNNMQSAIGAGYVNKNSAAIKTGSCDGVANLTGRPSGTDNNVDVVWRGIEGLWGNVWEFVDGVNWNGGTYYVCNNPSEYADDTSTNYTALSFKGSTNWSDSFITEEGLDTGNNKHVMIPAAAGSGSDSTYICDSCWSTTGWKVLEHGADWYGMSYGGMFACKFTDPSSYTGPAAGSRLFYIPQ